MTTRVRVLRRRRLFRRKPVKVSDENFNFAAAELANARSALIAVGFLKPSDSLVIAAHDQAWSNAYRRARE